MITKISSQHLKKAVLNFIISPQFAALVLLCGGGIEFTANQPIFVDLLDKGRVLGTCLALAMSVIMSSLSVLTAKLLAKGRVYLAILPSLLATGLFTIIFFAYK